MKIKIDRDLCEANGVCMDHAPAVFDIDDDEVLHVSEEALTDANRGAIEQAVKRCPRGALTLED
jgi:ferredoxin